MVFVLSLGAKYLNVNKKALTYGNEGLHKVVDLGVRWKEETSLLLRLYLELILSSVTSIVVE